MRLSIHKGDSYSTRKAKQSFNEKQKRKDKVYFLAKNHANNSGVKKIFRQKKRLTFHRSIEIFLGRNQSLLGKNNKLVLKLNKDFSLFHNPVRVLKAMTELGYHAKTFRNNPKFVFDGHVSFGAMYLLDNLSWEFGKKRKWVISKSGFPAEDLSVLANIKSFVSANYEDDNEFMINERVQINRNNPSANQQYKTRATEITNMLEKAIRDLPGCADFNLSFEAQGAIKSTIGESFDNIHLHAHETTFGTLCGFYDKRNKEITILIYNFGKTIPETFTDANVPANIVNEINTILNTWTKKKIINFTKSGDFIGENGLTLLAIQEGISSKMKEDPSRGHGIMDFIEHCFQLSNETEIVIISGRTAIRIDKRYPMSNANVLGRPRRILAFNEHNDIYSKPDANYVVNTGVHFNGVLIEAKIPLTNFENE